MKKFNLSVMLIMFFVLIYATAVFASQNSCDQKIIIKNPNGKYSFGKILEPPGDYSVWFPIVPRAIAIDSIGDIYIGDSVKYRVLKFDRNGKFITSFKLQPPARMKKPELSHIIQDMAVDKNDNLYVINLFEYRVEIYKRNGRFLRSFNYHDDEIDCVNGKYERGYRPERINIDEMNNVYLFHRNSMPYACGGVYSPQGRLLKKGIQVDYHGRGKQNYDERQMVDFNGYYYELPTKTTDKTLSIKDINNHLLKKCDNLELAVDDDGEIYKTDKAGNIYTFDYYKTLNVIRINLFTKLK
mgnify:CR=1 FL=1